MKTYRRGHVQGWYRVGQVVGYLALSRPIGTNIGVADDILIV